MRPVRYQNASACAVPSCYGRCTPHTPHHDAYPQTVWESACCPAAHPMMGPLLASAGLASSGVGARQQAFAPCGRQRGSGRARESAKGLGSLQAQVQHERACGPHKVESAHACICCQASLGMDHAHVARRHACTLKAGRRGDRQADGQAQTALQAQRRSCRSTDGAWMVRVRSPPPAVQEAKFPLMQVLQAAPCNANTTRDRAGGSHACKHTCTPCPDAACDEIGWPRPTRSAQQTKHIVHCHMHACMPWWQIMAAGAKQRLAMLSHGNRWVHVCVWRA